MPHAPDQFLLQLPAIFVSRRLRERWLERVRLPSVLDEIPAGIAFGPFALN
jgi:Kef-type K+ transport system membrane component KefB